MYFFLEHQKLVAETSSFGPDSTNPTTKYNVTTQFSLSGQAKAFACQESMMLVLPSTDNSLVTVVLQPMDGLTIPFPKIRFYVYRGLLKSSFMTGSAIKPKTDPDCSDFIKRLWLGHERRQSCFPTVTIPDPTPADLGFDDSMANRGLEEIFNRAFTGVSAQLVREGEWIGDFSVNCCGFEIITDTDHLVLDLDYAKNTEQIFDVSGFGTDIFKIRAEKEKVLNYLDSAAFWGMHYETGVDVYDAAVAGEHTTLKEGLLYAAIIDKYTTTKNRVYLDIRSEYGYSYNFYQNYTDGSIAGNNLKFKTDHALPYADHNYEQDWPIFFTDGTTGDPHDFGAYVIQLRVNDNIKPLVFIQNRKNTPSPALPPFIRDQDLLNGAATDWTKDIELRFPHFVEPLGSNVFVANYLRLQYFRQAVNPASPATVHKNTLFVNGVFGGINDGNTFAGTPFNMIRNNKKNLVSDHDFSFVSETRVFYNAQNVLFMATLLFSDRASKRFFPVIPPTKKDKPLIASGSFPAEMIFNKFRAENAAGTQHADILQVAGYNDAAKTTNKENIYLLGLTRAEFDTLKNLPGLSADHERYLEFEEIPPPFTDKTGFPFKAYKLKLRGFQPDGTQIITVSPTVDIVVFSAGGTIYCSKDFAAQQQHIPDGLPDPGTLKEWDYVGSNHYVEAAVVTVRDIKVFNEDRRVPLNARLFFPAESDNIVNLGSNQSNISSRLTSYPLVVVVHGNGHLYETYDDLCRHLAENGFIAASIDCRFEPELKVLMTTNTRHSFVFDFQFYEFDEVDLKIYKSGKFTGFLGELLGTVPNLMVRVKHVHHMEQFGRAHLLFQHLPHLKTLLGSRAQFDNIGLLGHSRGGEGVLIAARNPNIAPANDPPIHINTDPSTFQIKSIVSLSPSDRGLDAENLTQDIPFFVLYGSRDGDLMGEKRPRSTGFALWDRAINQKLKSMAFVHGATHNGFITKNSDYIFPSVTLDEAVQKNIANSYINAFFRMTLKNEAFWKPLFTGEKKPRSVVFPATKGGIYLQFQEASTGRKVVDDFENGPWHNSTIGGAPDSVEITSVASSPTTPTEDAMHLLDPYSPHDTTGLKVVWNTDDLLTFKIPTGKRDVENFSHISFRLARVFEKSGLYKDVAVQLTDENNKCSEVLVSDNSLFEGFTIPDPDRRIEGAIIPRENADPLTDRKTFTKSAMITVRVPLTEFNVNLKTVKQLSFTFPVPGSGEVTIDNIEFTN